MFDAVGHLPQLQPEIILRQRRTIVNGVQANTRQGLHAGSQVFNPPKPILLSHQQVPTIRRAQGHPRHRSGGK